MVAWRFAYMIAGICPPSQRLQRAAEGCMPWF
jgi:hypothetical protein